MPLPSLCACHRSELSDPASLCLHSIYAFGLSVQPMQFPVLACTLSVVACITTPALLLLPAAASQCKQQCNPDVCLHHAPTPVLCWYRSHTVKRQSAVAQKQPLVVRHSSHENLPANLLSPSLEASHDIATPSGDPLHPRPSVTPAAAARPALLQLQTAPQQTDISASQAAAYSQNKSASATGKLRATAPDEFKSDVLPSTTLPREPFAAVQANSMSANAAQSSGSHSSSTASGHRVQRSMAQGLQSHLADPYQMTAVRQVGDPAMLRGSGPASDSGLCSSSGSFGLSSHHASQQASHMRLPVSTNSGDTAASSSTTNTGAIRVDQGASRSHELADRDGEADSTSKTRAESLPAALLHWG